MLVQLVWPITGTIFLLFIFRSCPYLISKITSVKKKKPFPSIDAVGIGKMVRCPSGNYISVMKFGLDSNPVMVLVHGLLSSGLQWGYQVEYFSENYSIYVIDLPGHGLSLPVANADVGVFADDLYFLVIYFNILNPILYGHSIGGMVILDYLKRYSDIHTVKSIILQHTTIQNPVLTTSLSKVLSFIWRPLIVPFLRFVIFAPLVFTPISFISYWSGISVLFYRYIYFTGHQSTEELNLMVNFARKSSPEAVANLLVTMPYLQLENDLEKIVVPTLIISGEKDRVTIPEASEFIKCKIKHAVIFQTAEGHISMIEDPDKVNHAVSVFLK